MQNWFSTLKQFLFPSFEMKKEEAETKELVATVGADQKALQGMHGASDSSSVPSKPVQQISTLSPFASRILEKAKIDSLKDEDDREKVTLPAQLFMTNKEAKKRVDHIQSIALEKSKIAQNKFVDAAKVMPDIILNSFAKKTDQDKES